MRVLLCTREGAVLGRTRAITHLHGLVVNAPEASAISCASSTPMSYSRVAPPAHRALAVDRASATITALRSTARRALALEAEAADLESQLELIVTRVTPDLLAEPVSES